MSALFLVGALTAIGPAQAGATPFFSATGDQVIARYGGFGVTLPDGRVLLLGGDEEGNPVTSVESFAAAANAFSGAGYLSMDRPSSAGATLSDGRVLVAGGSTEAGSPLDSAEIFNPATHDATPTGSPLIGRAGADAATLPDGRVLIAGGEDQSHPYLASAEIFNPATGTFSSTGSMAVKRWAPALAPLPDGRILVAGGFDRELPSDTEWRLSSAEVFDPATGTFAPTGSLLQGKSAALAAPLPDGRVLIAGGEESAHNGQGSDDAEIFDPATQTFSATASMLDQRAEAAGGLLPDGRVLIAGGASFSLQGGAETFNTDPNPGSTGIDFGNVSLHSMAGPTPLLITNHGAQPLHVTAAVTLGGANSGDFAIANDACSGATIVNSQSCRVDIRFTPSATGVRSATLLLTDDAAASPQSFSVRGVGAKGPVPKVKLVKKPAKKVKTKKAKAKVTFKFSSSAGGATFECKLDKAKFKPCKSPSGYKVKPGAHSFQVRATAAGTTGRPASYGFKVVRKRG